MLKTYSRQVKKESPDLSKICRMCLTQFAEMLDIFVDEVEPLSNVSVIKFCVGIDCEENDGLPSRMCSNCYRSLGDFFAFKRMCFASDLRLKSCRDAMALRKSEAAIVVEDRDTKVKIEDELSLAHSNDLGLLETDCIHPGAPDEVLSQIKKSDEEEDCELPRNDCHVEPAPAWVPKPQDEHRVLIAQHPISVALPTDLPPKKIEPSSIPPEQLSDDLDEDDDDDIDAFLPPIVRASQRTNRVPREKLKLENENIMDANQSSHNSKLLAIASASPQTMGHPRKELVSVSEEQVAVLAVNPIGLEREDVNLGDTQGTAPVNQPPKVQETTHQVTNASAPVKQVIVSPRKPMIGATAPQVAVDASPETAFKEPHQSEPEERKPEVSKKFTCQECAKQFFTPNSLRRHIKNHGPAEWKCPDCSKMFHQLTSMKRHQVLHSGRRFACPDCSKVLLSRDGLKCHMRTHHSDRKGPEYYKFKCSHCNKCFAHSSGLSRHMAIHRGVQYQCELCSKKFNDSSQVKRHRIKHHPTSSVESSAGSCSASEKASSGVRNVSGTDSEGPTSLG